MPVLDKNLEARSPLIFIFFFFFFLFFFPLELLFFLGFNLLIFSIKICRSVFSLRSIPFQTVSPRQWRRTEETLLQGLSCHYINCLSFFLSISLTASGTGPLMPSSRQTGCHPILMTFKLNQARSNKHIICLSLSPHLNYIVIIRAAGAADIPAVHQHRAPVALRPC